MLIRHGKTEWSTKGRFAGRMDVPLLSSAEFEAIEVGDRIRRMSFDMVMSSPLSRARRTAQLLCSGEEFIVDDRLRERDYGDYEGLTTAEIRRRHPRWNVWSDDVPNGETLEEMTYRVDSLHRELLDSSAGSALIVAHGHWIRLFTARWLGLHPRQAALFRLEALGIVKLGWERESPVVLGWGN